MNEPPGDDAIAAWIATERQRLADFFETLEAQDWAHPSWCAGWTNRVVLAHLTVAPRTSTPAMVVAMARHRGDFDAMTDQRARRRARRFDVPVLITQLRDSAQSARRMPGSAPMDPLVDLLIHGQDVARPIGRDLAMPPQPTLAALAFTVESPFYTPPDRIADLQLIAEDTDWTHRDGLADEVHGAAGDLLLATTGRAGALDRLHGRGISARLDDM